MATIVYQLEDENSTKVTFTKYTATQSVLETERYIEEFSPGAQPPIIIVGEFYEEGPGHTIDNAAYLYPDGTVHQWPPEASS